MSLEMAPSRMSSEPSALNPTKKHSLYILSDFHSKAVQHAHSLFHIVPHTSPEAKCWRQHATAILIKDYAITASDIYAAPQLRVIGKQGVGVDQIDLEACEKAGVRVINTPGVNAGAVAEMTLALALSVSRSIPRIWCRMVKDGESVRKETVNGTLLGGKVVGVIGMGNIGQAVARVFHGGLNCGIVAYDPYLPWNTDGSGTNISTRGWDTIPHQRVERLEELLEVSDVVSIHVPLTPSTKGLISYAQLEQMKGTAILLNTARGGIVDEDDLLRGLDQGLIWGAGFDCHVTEPPTKEKYERLWSQERYVGTPHIAAATDETQVATTNAAIDGVWRFLNDTVIESVPLGAAGYVE